MEQPHLGVTNKHKRESRGNIAVAHHYLNRPAPEANKPTV